MGIGMLFGCDGLFKIQFSNYTVAEEICTVALSFIMFYGGFNTKWSTAKAIASKAIFLSTFAGLRGAASIVFSIMIKRAGDTIVPNGDTVICVQDSVILSVPSYEPSGNENLKEILITNSNKWSNKKIKTLNLPNNVLIALIKRGNENLISDAETMLLPRDKIVLFK
jgi:NhaP-type Na+/H+ and K+/H+ antiporter